MPYRPELDGLRALAVMAVILFHAGFAPFAGGYAGVDVFFVLSGYLITTLILRDLDRQEFSLGRFYERRARRLLPALVFVLACLVPLAWISMIPEQLHELAQGLIGAASLSSNLVLWQAVDYFAAQAEENPLLHLWSLAVEAQFYLLFPLLVAGLRRAGHGWLFAGIAGLTALSLLLAEIGSRGAPAASFYLLPSRAWELGAGALCAVWLQGRPPRPDDRLAAAGLAMVLAGLALADRETVFPSVLTLLPVVGTGLLILFAPQGSRIARLLSARGVVLVGLISYSAYLWHQPVFALARLRDSDGAPGPLVMAGLTALVFPLAWATWRFVETPFRRRTLAPTGRAMAGWSAAGLGAMIALGASGLASGGWRSLWEATNPARAAPLALIEQARATRREPTDDGACRFSAPTFEAASPDRLERCRARHGPGVLVLGDSHARDVLAGLVATGLGGPFVLGITQGACRPDRPTPDCGHDRLVPGLAQNPGLFRILLYTQAGYPLLRRPGGHRGRQIFRDIPLSRRIDPEAFRISARQIEAITVYLEALAVHVPVVWLGPRLEPHVSLRRILQQGCTGAYALRAGQADLYATLDARLAQHLAGRGLRYVSQIEATGFDIARDFLTCEALLWADGDHWSLVGARHFITRLAEAGALEVLR